MITDVTCTLEAAFMTGNVYHLVRWTDSEGNEQSQKIHCCENSYEAVSEVLGVEYAESFAAPCRSM
jgi:hypothetical protein